MLYRKLYETLLDWKRNNTGLRKAAANPKSARYLTGCPRSLATKTGVFFVTPIDKNARLQNYEESFKWLEEAGVALPCRNGWLTKIYFILP